MGFSIDKKGRLFFLYSAMHSGAEASLKRLSGLLTTESSALDTISERLVHDALARVLVGRTAIFIAHRLSTVKNCDRIIVLND